MRLCIEQMPTNEQPLLAGDHTAWSRREAFTLKDRTIEHQPTPIAGNKPVTVGHGFSTIAWIPEMESSWALPLRHERITSFETPRSRAAFQLQQVCKHLQVRPIVAYDSEYGNASFVKQTVGIEAICCSDSALICAYGCSTTLPLFHHFYKRIIRVIAEWH